MNPIFNALAGGYSATQIISFIQSFIPKLTPKINAAKKQGYSSEKIVEFLSDTMQSEANSSYQTSNRIHSKNREENKRLTKDLLKQGLNLGATAIGANVLSKMVPNLGRMINNRANVNTPPPSPNLPISTQPSPNRPLPPSPAPTPNTTQPGPNIGQQIGQQAANPVAQAMQTGTNPAAISPSVPVQTQPNIPENPQMDFGQILDQLGVRNKVDALRESNPPEVISKIIRYGLPKDQVKQIDSQIPLDQVIQGYLQSAPPVETMKEKISKGVPFGQNKDISPPVEENRFKGLIEEGRNKFQEHMNPSEIPEKPKNIQPIEKELDIFTQSNQGNKKVDGPQYSLNEKSISRYLNSKNGKMVGTLGEFFEGSYLRDKFKDVLRIPVYKGYPSDESGGHLESEEGNIRRIVINPSSADIFDVLIEEATHASRVKKGRSLSNEEVNYDERPEEISAKKHIEFLKKKYLEEKANLNQEKVNKLLEERKNKSYTPSLAKTGSSVLLPDGNIGEIESVKQGIASVKVGDKIRNKKISELMESPKEAAQAALELIKSFTPEHHRSAHHALNMYDPETKSAQFLFHSGEGYIVEDISPDEYERLANELDMAKTTGETKIGAWATGAGSRGAAYQKIVKNLKKPYRKIQVGYNLFKEFQRLINEKE